MTSLSRVTLPRDKIHKIPQIFFHMLFFIIDYAQALPHISQCLLKVIIHVDVYLDSDHHHPDPVHLFQKQVFVDQEVALLPVLLQVVSVDGEVKKVSIRGVDVEEPHELVFHGFQISALVEKHYDFAVHFFDCGELKLLGRDEEFEFVELGHDFVWFFVGLMVIFLEDKSLHNTEAGGGSSDPVFWLIVLGFDE